MSDLLSSQVTSKTNEFEQSRLIIRFSQELQVELSKNRTVADGLSHSTAKR